MNEDIEDFLNDKTYILAYRFNYDSAREVNQQLINYVKQLQQENKQLKSQIKALDEIMLEKIDIENHWNELKEYAKENLYFYSGYQGEDLEIDVAIQGVLDKMQEIEKSDGNE